MDKPQITMLNTVIQRRGSGPMLCALYLRLITTVGWHLYKIQTQARPIYTVPSQDSGYFGGIEIEGDLGVPMFWFLFWVLGEYSFGKFSELYHLLHVRFSVCVEFFLKLNDFKERTKAIHLGKEKTWVGGTTVDLYVSERVPGRSRCEVQKIEPKTGGEWPGDTTTEL